MKKQSAAIPPPPSDAVSIDEAVRAGTLTATIEDIVAIPVPGIPGTPFHGQADLVIENISAQNGKAVLLEGAEFQPVGGDAQSLISHQNPVEPPTLPPTGGGWWAILRILVALLNTEC